MKPTPPQVIHPDAVYGQAEFRARTKLEGDWSWRRVRRDGLPVIRIGNERYIRGSDWIAFIDRASGENKSVNGNGSPQ